MFCTTGSNPVNVARFLQISPKARFCVCVRALWDVLSINLGHLVNNSIKIFCDKVLLLWNL